MDGLQLIDARKEYAMKTEIIIGHKRMLRQKVEFVVMGLVGPSLEDIRKKTQITNFSRTSAMHVSTQTQSIWDLHELGWLHRDIKPQNFAVGLGEAEQTVYMLDFGIARQMFKKDTKEVKPPRIRVKFLGTLRFVSRACHLGMEQGKKDDLETWLFMAFDLFDQMAGLPWKRSPDRSRVVEKKDKFSKHPSNNPRVYSVVPKDMKRIVKYVEGLHYADEPDCRYIQNTLYNIAKEEDFPMKEKIDWAAKMKRDDMRKDDVRPKANCSVPPGRKVDKTAAYIMLPLKKAEKTGKEPPKRRPNAPSKMEGASKMGSASTMSLASSFHFILAFFI